MAKARAKFDDETDQALRDAAAHVTGLLAAKALQLSESTGCGLPTCTSKLFRPFLVDQSSEKAKAALTDNRERLWAVQIWFWDVTEGLERGELLAENDTEEVRGLRGVSEIIREYVDLVHEDDGLTADQLPDFVPSAMAKRMGGIRAAISKGGGKASLRIRYSLGGDGALYMCQADIARA